MENENVTTEVVEENGNQEQDMNSQSSEENQNMDGETSHVTKSEVLSWIASAISQFKSDLIMSKSENLEEPQETKKELEQERSL